MIYAMYYDFQEVKKIVAYKSLYDMSIFDKAKAESIFLFDGSKTIYYKNRDNNPYQYSTEEQVVITLQAVLL